MERTHKQMRLLRTVDARKRQKDEREMCGNDLKFSSTPQAKKIAPDEPGEGQEAPSCQGTNAYVDD